jgi:hypothetical protein
MKTDDDLNDTLMRAGDDALRDRLDWAAPRSLRPGRPRASRAMA